MLGLRRNDAIFGLGIASMLVIFGTDVLIHRWGLRTLYDGEVISIVQIPVVGHPLFLQWLGIKVPVVTAMALVAFALLLSLPAIWRNRLVTAIPLGFAIGAAGIVLATRMSYHHDLLLSLDVPQLGVVRWSVVFVPSVLAVWLLLVIETRWLWRFRQENGPLPIAMEAALLMRRGERQEKEERLDQAEMTFRRAYDRVRERLGENDPRTLGPLLRLAWFTLDHPPDHGSEAGLLLRRSWALAEKGRHTNRATMARLLDGLGSATLRDGNSHGALRLYEDAVRVAEEVDGAMSWQVATPLRHLAWAMMVESKLEDAERLAERSLTIARRSYGRRSQELVPFIATLASIRDRQGGLAEALRLREEALGLTGRSTGPNTARAITLIDLAGMRAKQGKNREAEKLYEEALTMASADRAERRRVGPDALEGLASLRQREGRLSEAERFARQALEEQEVFWGGDSLMVVGPLVRLGDLYTRQDKLEEARSHLNRAIAIIESRSGPTDGSLAIPLQLIGLVERAEGNYELAETMMLRAIAVTQAQHGQEDRYLVPGLVLLGAIVSERERHKEAAQIFERGLILAEKVYGRNHSETAKLLAQFAYAREAADDLDGAERLHREEIASLQRSAESNDSAVADAFERFAEFLERHDRTDDAVAAKRQSMELMVKHAWQNPVDSI